MKDIEFINDQWRQLLQHNQINSFESLWQFEQGNWFEAPNYRRGGWSGVSRTNLALPDGSELSVFIKRQENHVYRSWQNLFRPMATFEREYRNILHFQQLGIPTVDLVYFGQRVVDGRLRAILITLELSGYQTLDAFMHNAISNRQAQARIFAGVAKAMRAMHAQQFQHNCLYPKHLFVSEQGINGLDARFIDLEKAKRRPFKGNVALRDLGTLHRHSENITRTNRLRFFLEYMQEKRLSVVSKRMLKLITKKKTSRMRDIVLQDVENLTPELKDAT